MNELDRTLNTILCFTYPTLSMNSTVLITPTCLEDQSKSEIAWFTLQIIIRWFHGKIRVEVGKKDNSLQFRDSRFYYK